MERREGLRDGVGDYSCLCYHIYIIHIQIQQTRVLTLMQMEYNAPPLPSPPPQHTHTHKRIWKSEIRQSCAHVWDPRALYNSNSVFCACFNTRAYGDGDVSKRDRDITIICSILLKSSCSHYFTNFCARSTKLLNLNVSLF